MKKIIFLLIIVFISFSSYSQIRKIGTANDSINFTSIVAGSDSSIYFIARKGDQHLFILKTNKQLDTLWSKTISALDSYNYPNAIFLDVSQELLINCSSNQLVKLDSSGSIIFNKQIILPSASYFNVRSTLIKNDSLLFAVYRYDSTGYHNGIAIADTSGNITAFHDYGARAMEKIMEYNGGYYVSPAGIVLDASFNILEEYYIYNSSGYSCGAGISTVFNGNLIVGANFVYYNISQDADEIYKITQSGLQWVVKDDLNVGLPGYQITPVKLFPNGNIASVMGSYDNYFIGIIDSTGYPVLSYRLDVLPDNYNHYNMIGVSDLGNAIAFAFGNVFGIADTSGVPCFSTSGSMDQYNPITGLSNFGSAMDNMYNLTWNVTPLNDTSSQTNLTIDAICTPVSVEDLSDENEIVIYPNPWIDHFQISGLSQLSGKLTITDISGKIVYESFVKGDNPVIVSEYLLSGYYLLKIEGMNKPFRTIKLN